jgi:hypothetical protein
MINQKFLSNWKKILVYNKKVQFLSDSLSIEEKVRIPFTPIKVDPKILYSFFEIYYPKFINDQQNILDLIISDDQNRILAAYLYETNKAGIHEEFQVIPNDFVLLNEDELNNIENFYNKIQTALVKSTGVRFSTLRILKKTGIDFLNLYLANLEEIVDFHIFKDLLDLFQTLLEENLLLIYPTPNIYRFSKELINFLDNIKISHIFQFICDLITEVDISFLLNSRELPIILSLNKDTIRSNRQNLFIEITTPKEIGLNLDGNNKQKLLKGVREKLNSKNAYFVDQNDIYSILNEIFELEIPLEINKLELIFQKLLFGFRNFENNWFKDPKPLIYNSIVKFFTRLFRFNLNLKKVSYWSIPRLFFNIIESNFGIYSRIVLILTSIDGKKTSRIEYIKTAFKKAILIEFRNREITKIVKLNRNDLFSEEEINTLNVIRANVSQKYGFISAVFNIDKFLLSEIIQNFSSEVFRFTPFSQFKVLKLFEEDQLFNVYPEVPELKFFKEKGIKKFLKILLPVLIDKYEF